jgi:hypothetical protein
MFSDRLWILALLIGNSNGFTTTTTTTASSSSVVSSENNRKHHAFARQSSPCFMIKNPLQSFLDTLSSPIINPPTNVVKKETKARDLVTKLITEDKCFSNDTGAKAFGETCAVDVLYEDCFESKPFVGKEVCINIFFSVRLFQWFPLNNSHTYRVV